MSEESMSILLNIVPRSICLLVVKTDVSAFISGMKIILNFADIGAAAKLHTFFIYTVEKVPIVNNKIGSVTLQNLLPHLSLLLEQLPRTRSFSHRDSVPSNLSGGHFC